MKRREFVGGLAAAAGVAACAQDTADCDNGASAGHETFEWSCVTSWPPRFPGLGMAPENLATRVARASGGRLKIKVYGAGELVPAFEVFDAVSRGTVEMGHGAAYYHKGKLDAAQFFTAVPFGLTSLELNGWLYYGGGMELEAEDTGNNLVDSAGRVIQENNTAKGVGKAKQVVPVGNLRETKNTFVHGGDAAFIVLAEILEGFSLHIPRENV